jgi:hypothetical protein
MPKRVCLEQARLLAHIGRQGRVEYRIGEPEQEKEERAGTVHLFKYLDGGADCEPFQRAGHAACSKDQGYPESMPPAHALGIGLVAQ